MKDVGLEGRWVCFIDTSLGGEHNHLRRVKVNGIFFDVEERIQPEREVW